MHAEAKGSYLLPMDAERIVDSMTHAMTTSKPPEV